MWHARLKELRPLSLEVVQPGSQAARRWSFYQDRYHYLASHILGKAARRIDGD